LKEQKEFERQSDVKAENPISKAKSNLVVSNMVRAVVGIGE
jgi:hypothetical protein